MKSHFLIFVFAILPSHANAQSFDWSTAACDKAREARGIDWNAFIEKDWLHYLNCRRTCPRTRECTQGDPSSGMSPSNPIECRVIADNKQLEAAKICGNICSEEYSKSIRKKCLALLTNR